MSDLIQRLRARKVTELEYIRVCEDAADALEVAEQVTNMLILCGEDECRDVKGYPKKLRALIDGLITQRRRAEVAERELSLMREDAERFQYLQNIATVEAQAFFWNHVSRKERVKAIDAARKA